MRRYTNPRLLYITLPNRVAPLCTNAAKVHVQLLQTAVCGTVVSCHVDKEQHCSRVHFN